MANCCQEMKHTQVILQDLSNFISEKSNEEDRDQKIDKFMIYNVSLVLNRKIELFALRKKISEKAQQLGQLTNTKFEEFKNQFKNFKISEEKIIKKEVTSSDFANESEVVGEEQDNSDDVNFKRKPEFVKENYFEQKKRRRKKKRKKILTKKKGSSKRNRAIEKKKSRKRRLKIRNKNSSSSLNSLSDQSSHSKTDIQEETSSENYSDISSNTDSEDLKHFKRKEKIIMKEKGEKKGKQKQNDQKKEKLKIKKKKQK